MPARPARHNAHLLKLAELPFRELHLIQENFAGVLRNAAQQGVPDGAGLLENLFLHEMFVATLFRHDGIPGDVLRRPLDRASIVVHDADAIFGQNGNVAVDEEEDVTRMFKQRRNVAGNKIFTIAQADDGRRPQASGNDFLWVFRRKKDQGVNATQLFKERRTASSSGASSREFFSTRCATISVSVSVANL